MKKQKKDNKESIYRIDYDKTVIFKERVTRFTVRFEFKGKEKEKGEDFAHLHDTGRLKELLVDGAELLIKKADKEERKTKWDVIAVKINNETVLINTAFHRYIAEAVFNNEKLSPFGKPLYIKPEMKCNKSKMDFYMETEKEKIYIETKGCTLVEDNIAKFPGAPSVRAVKHLRELMELKEEGFRAAVIILIFRRSEIFAPEHNIDREFSETFYEAMEKAVEIYPILLKYEDKNIYFEKNVGIVEKSVLFQEKK